MVDIALPYFLARPAAAGPRPGIVVIHEGGGISAQLLRVCQRLAGEGYAVIAPDLFFRSGGTGAHDFGTLIGSLDDSQVALDLASCVGLLHDLGCRTVGVTGFCLGGRITYQAALADLGFAAAASFYGSGIDHMLGRPLCPVLLFFGEQDEYIPVDDIRSVQAHHGDAVISYPDAGHGFLRDGSDSYREAAALDAWKRLLSFFGDHLTA